MVFTPATAREHHVRVIEHVRLSSRYFLLKLDRPADLIEPVAGTFVQVEVPHSGRFFLRRPFSVFDCDETSLDLLIVELGEGTHLLRRLRSGDMVSFYGPLGGAFPHFPDKKVIALGGGVGLAPLYMYGFRGPGECGPNYRLLYGGRTREDLFVDHINIERDGVRLATDDGSYGFKGNVVELAKAELARDGADVMFSCGPTPMMQAADRLARELEIPHFVSLENRMACALGACRACVVPTVHEGDSPYRTVCHDGPVFNAAELLMDELPVP